MPTEEQVRERLEQVLVPGAMRSLVQLNLVRKVAVSNGKADIALASAALHPEVQDWVKARVRDVTRTLPGVKDTEVSFVEAKPQDVNDVRQVIAVMSGKGGVGKSLVAGLIGFSLARRGHKVGILDADITGPSIPRMFGLAVRPAGSDTGLIPVLSRAGIAVMSINLLLEHEDQPVIWRGPLIGSAIKQFWGDVLWGKLDYLLVDLPPGTADAPLTVMQSLPVSGVVIVFSPQELAAMVVKKAVNMVRQMQVPILGVVENMSYLALPKTGKKMEVFGRSRAEEMVKAVRAPLLARIPIDPELARLCDEGNIERYDSETLDSLAEAFLQATSARAESASPPLPETR
ncbi:MAG: Mrp/NBP35 family ATP-binding protein [Chloroflexota bacterium]